MCTCQLYLDRAEKYSPNNSAYDKLCGALRKRAAIERAKKCGCLSSQEQPTNAQIVKLCVLALAEHKTSNTA